MQQCTSWCIGCCTAPLSACTLHDCFALQLYTFCTQERRYATVSSSVEGHLPSGSLHSRHFDLSSGSMLSSCTVNNWSPSVELLNVSLQTMLPYLLGCCIASMLVPFLLFK